MLGTDRQGRGVGVALGLAVVAVLIMVSRVTAGPGGLGADVRMRTSPTGELAVSTKDAFLQAIDLRPGQQAAGRVFVHNQTGSALSGTARAELSSADLDEQVHARMTVDGAVVADGTLGRLSDGSTSFLLPSGHEADVVVEVALVPGADHYEGRLVDVALRFHVERATP